LADDVHTKYSLRDAIVLNYKDDNDDDRSDDGDDDGDETEMVIAMMIITFKVKKIT
jgi:hypothetical protein